jgi:hypothetical protein
MLSFNLKKRNRKKKGSNGKITHGWAKTNGLNRENKKKNNWKTKLWKKPIKIFKKPTNSVRFRFYKPKTGKTEPKPEKTEPNRFEPVFVLKNRTKTGWFELVLILKNQTKTNRFKPISVQFFLNLI